MNELSSRCSQPNNLALVLTLAVGLASCGNASERREAKSQSYIKPHDWQTICLDRFLIDLPGPVQIGAIEERYQGTYGFEGINDVGTKGLSWGKVTMAETSPTTAKIYADFYDSVSATMTSAERYVQWFKEQEEVIRDRTKKTLRGTPEEIAFAKEMLNDKIKSLKTSRYGAKVSGKAHLSAPKAFAFRRGDEYSVVYLDKVDNRLRVFEGPITQRQLESPEAAAFEYRRFQRIYHPRVPTDIPSAPGFCTPFGLIDEAAGLELDTSLEIPFRSLKFPNLIFQLTVTPADPEGKRNIQKQPNMDADRAPLHVIGVKRDYGPVAENILGTPGRSVGFEYGPNCSRTSCRPADQAYEFEAKTFGEPGRVDQPNLTLHMIALTSDDYKLKRVAQPDAPSYNTPTRPALSGHVPPPFDEGTKIFEQVLRSIRVRPGAIPTSGAAAPVTTAGVQSIKK
jgi:hypothetical protein